MSTLRGKRIGKRFKEFLSFYLLDHGFVRAIYPNFYAIDDKMYRSSQPSPRQLKNLKKKYGLKTIINLRGENGLAGYGLEKEACKNLELKLIDFRAYSRNPPEYEDIKKLIEIFNHIDYPALMHCKSGSDRTGIVATLYRILHLKQSVEYARYKELHWIYGHIKKSNTGVLDYFFDEYLSVNQNDPQSFLDWAKNYDHISLKNKFRSASWSTFLVDKILRRE